MDVRDVLYQTIRVEVDIVNLFEYAEENRRNWVEGNQIFKNNHVVIEGVTKLEGDQIHVFCSCLRGSNPSEPPRQDNIVTSTLFKNWSIHCSCPAGNHRCKHKFACLLFIHTTKVLEVLTATDVKQRWGKVAKVQAENLYTSIPLSGLCIQRSKAAGSEISDELSKELFKMFIAELPESALAKSFKGRNVIVRSKDQSQEQHQGVLPFEGWICLRGIQNIREMYQLKKAIRKSRSTCSYTWRTFLEYQILPQDGNTMLNL
ncbi:uncharacterized protein LOC110678311 [Aedes aegypti]|uniref:SWIM-type domain-containing protein n=1 Tax=Aedes aegypti TaxID=7159 RepID=A0A6I8U8M1_AEDAE|nr:uncharacterized protein LOC110678311 [Aedes aegypti]XP_021706688.1 uncharacterized protein LOC110678311 [Aedes aegypti]